MVLKGHITVEGVYGGKVANVTEFNDTNRVINQTL